MSGTRLLVALRLHAGVNAKNRPDWFSKERCVRSLASAVQAARAAGMRVDGVVYVDDAGPVLGTELLDAARLVGRIEHHVAGSGRRSWQSHLLRIKAAPELAELAEDGFIYLVEDDHLHLEDALVRAGGCPAPYGLLYSLSKDASAERIDSQGFTWQSALRGVSSCLVRKDVFLRDERLLRLMAYGGAAFDLLTWKVIHADAYFTPGDIAFPFRPRPPFVFAGYARSTYYAMWRVFSNLLIALRKSTDVYAVEPCAATHCENGWLAPGPDWKSISDASS